MCADVKEREREGGTTQRSVCFALVRALPPLFCLYLFIDFKESMADCVMNHLQGADGWVRKMIKKEYNHLDILYLKVTMQSILILLF